MTLIVDLDDTLYETSSIDSSVFQDALAPIISWCNQTQLPRTKELLMDDLWTNPFDYLADKYQIPKSVQNDFFSKINELDYNLNLDLFDDYSFLKNIDSRKFLVTTGFKKLQEAKIESLNISDDFEEIFIDDPTDSKRLFKKGIFKNIIQKAKCEPKDCWVIGDNVNSELKAGKELGMYTILRLNAHNRNTEFSPYVDRSIKSFREII